MIKAIIFDFDYTLSNRGPSIYQGFSYLVNKYFKDLDDIEKEAIIQRMITLDEFGTISRSHINDYMKEKYDVDMTIDFNDLSAYMAPFTILDEDAIKVLDYLKKNTDYKLAILTNGNIDTQRMKLDTVKISHYFDEMIVSKESGFNKPDKRAFEYVANKLDVKCEECLYVGDVMFNDILGAYHANMQYVLLNNDRKRIYGPCIKTINHLIELIDYIKDI